MVRRAGSTRRGWSGALLATTAGAALAASMSGCLERTISISSEPPGALVWLEDEEVGRTPLETDFTFYGDYDVRARLAGYEPVSTERYAPQPWYEFPGIDLIADLLPWTIHTRVHWDLVMGPTPEAAAAENGDPALRDAAERGLVERARELKGMVGGGK